MLSLNTPKYCASSIIFGKGERMVIPNASQFVLSNVAAKKLLMSSSDVSSVQYAPLNGTFAFETKQIETRAFTMEVSSLYLRLSTLSQIEFKTFRSASKEAGWHRRTSCSWKKTSRSILFYFARCLSRRIYYVGFLRVCLLVFALCACVCLYIQKFRFLNPLRLRNLPSRIRQ